MRVKEVMQVMHRLLARCEETADGCLIWTGFVNKGGYGRIGLGRREDGTGLVHVVVWEAEHGPLPEGYEVDHTCRNRRCVRHLEAVTHAENMRRARKDLCSKSLHVMEGDNVLHPERGVGWRRCRTCKNDSERARRKKG